MKTDDVKTIAVLGVGTMGPGIAQTFAQSGHTVRIYGRDRERCQSALLAIEKSLGAFLTHGLIENEQPAAVMARLSGISTLEDACRDADFVIEAFPEDLPLKKDLMARLDRLCPSQTILASNTSGLSITDMGASTGRPEKVVGTHFWNPPHLIPLVEVVRGQKTSQETMTIALELMILAGKTPVRVNKEVAGFIGTRLHQALIREAFYIAEEGIASLEDIDTVVKTSFGRRLAVTGPFETCDLGGLDIFLAAAGVWKDLSNADEPSRLLIESVKKGHLGAKTGRGLFDWRPDDVNKVTGEREQELIRYLKKDANPKNKEEEK
jgi:3-hydroxybutyryl-CoA dehydrogenase